MVRSATMRELLTTLSAAAALGTVALIVVIVTPSKQTTVLDFAPWKAPPWDSRAGQGQMGGGDWYDQPGDYIGGNQQNAPTQVLFDPYDKPWNHEPLSSKSIAKEKALYAFDKYAPMYGYGSQQRAAVQSLYESSSDPYRNDGETSEAKQEAKLYYKQKLNDFYHELRNTPMANQVRQNALVQSLYESSSDPYRNDGETSEAKQEAKLYYKQKLNDFYHELRNTPMAIEGRKQMLAMPWQVDGADRKLALAEKHAYYRQYFQRSDAGENALTRPTV